MLTAMQTDFWVRPDIYSTVSRYHSKQSNDDSFFLFEPGGSEKITLPNDPAGNARRFVLHR
jgi:hypothetical protein